MGIKLYQIVSKRRGICLFSALGGVECRTHFDPSYRSRGTLARYKPYRSGGQIMAKATLSRRRTRRRHVREKATIDHLVRAVWTKADERGTTHAPVTSSGLSVEEQVRKQWHPGLGGLALF